MRGKSTLMLFCREENHDCKFSGQGGGKTPQVEFPRLAPLTAV
jgi:hypothetical protein